MKEYMVEAHLHVKGNSWCGKTEPKEIVRIYKNLGYDAIIVTNHFNRVAYNSYFEGSDEEKMSAFFRTYEELKQNTEGLDVYFGVEFALQEDHYYLPLDKKCAELLVYGIKPEDFRMYALSIIEMDYPEFKAFCEEKGWLVFQAHPFRERSKRIAPEYIDGVESFNGNPRHVNRNFLARARKRKHDLLEVVGSDFHVEHDVSSAMLFKRKPMDETDIVALLKNREFTALCGKRALKKYIRKRKREE